MGNPSLSVAPKSLSTKLIPRIKALIYLARLFYLTTDHPKSYQQFLPDSFFAFAKWRINLCSVIVTQFGTGAFIFRDGSAISQLALPEILQSLLLSSMGIPQVLPAYHWTTSIRSKRFTVARLLKAFISLPRFYYPSFSICLAFASLGIH